MVRELLKKMPEVFYSVSVTTRSPRPGEKNGWDYYFISEEEFKKKKNADELIEWAQVHGYWYGTPRTFIDKNIHLGRVTLLDIDVQGGSQIKKMFPEAVLVFIAPPSLSILESRLRGRRQDDEATIQKRLRAALTELDQARAYDYLILNEQIPQALDQLRAIIVAERLRMHRSHISLPNESGNAIAHPAVGWEEKTKK